MKNKLRIGLALSGGGYRAAAYHLGTVQKLNELGILSNVDIISSISGGSIIGGVYCSQHTTFEKFYLDFYHKLNTKSCIKYVITSFTFFRFLLFILIGIFGPIYLTFTTYSYLGLPLLVFTIFILLRFQFKLFPVSHIIEKAYDKYFFNGRTLDDLKEYPALVIGSSNLHTGRPFIFSKQKVSDSVYEFSYSPPIYFKNNSFPIAKAVMASSCVPFAFTPIHLSPKYYSNTSDFKRVKPILVDGGVYDNQGIHKITQKKSFYNCEIVIISDAGGIFKKTLIYKNTIALLLRTVELFMYRIKSSQIVSHVYENIEQRPIAYISLGWDLEKCLEGFLQNLTSGTVLNEIIKLHSLKTEWIAEPQKYRESIKEHMKQIVGWDALTKASQEEINIARNVSTNLVKLTTQQLDSLIKHAASLTELQIKLYCPLILQPDVKNTTVS